MAGNAQKKVPRATAGTQENRPPDTTTHAGRWQEPFAQLPIWIIRRSDLSMSAKLVYAVIVDRIGNKGKAWPGYSRIAQDIGAHSGTAKRAVADLIAARLLIKIPRGAGLSHMYAVPDPATQRKMHPVQNAPGTHPAQNAPRPSANCAPTQRKLRPDPAQIAPIENQTQEPDPRTRPKNKRSTKPKRIKFSKQQIESIYQAYPKHVGKAKAIPAIEKALRLIAERGTREPVGWLLDRVEKFAGSNAGQQGNFTPFPATWMNQARYDDDDREWNNNNDQAAVLVVDDPLLADMHELGYAVSKHKDTYLGWKDSIGDAGAGHLPGATLRDLIRKHDGDDQALIIAVGKVMDSHE